MNDIIKQLSSDPDGLQTYDYIVNHVDSIDPLIDDLTSILLNADNSGQFLASSARFLHAIDSNHFHDSIGKLVEGAIAKDRERKYISSLLEALWGPNYQDEAEALNKTDDNFRRIYKRIFPKY